MSIPISDPIFTMMGNNFRRDHYRKSGDELPKHSHTFDHGCYIEKGSVKANWYNPDYETILKAGESGAMFRKGRPHSLTALEDDTYVMSVMPEES